MNSGKMRLLQLRDNTELAAENMAQARGRFACLADPSAAVRSVVAFNLFQTPDVIADRMAAILAPALGPDSVVLEPSAGLGRLYQAVRSAGHDGPMILAEQSPDCCRELYDLTREDRRAVLKQGDFLSMLFQVDAVIMNPPFKQGRDIRHILHALAMVKPGGRLVALCYNGPRQAQHLKPLSASWDVLPAGSFKAEGTRAEVVLLTIKKPL